jgi:hypothetical protein
MHEIKVGGLLVAMKSVRKPPPIVLTVLRSVHEATRESKPPRYVAIDALRLQEDAVRLEAAVLLAHLWGWLNVAGNRPLSVATTADGLQELERNRHLGRPAAD